MLRPDLLLDVRVGYLRSNIESNPLNYGRDVATQIGFPCNSTSCINVPGNIITSGLPTIYMVGTAYQSLGGPGCIPLMTIDDSYMLTGSVTRTWRSHNIKTGAGMTARQMGAGQSGAPQGYYLMIGGFTQTGNLLGDLITGQMANAQRSNTLNTPFYSTKEPSAYVQDDWHVRRWLTLNIGLRYDIFTPFTERLGQFSNFDTATGLLTSPSLPGAQKSGPTAGVTTDYRDIAPRFGFAATLGHGTVLRGGFGMTFWPGNYTLEALMKNAPFTDAFGCGLVSAAACGRFAASGGYFPLLSAGLPPPVVDLQSCQASLIQMQAARDLFPRSPERATRNLDDPIDMASGAIVEGRGAIQELRSQPAVQDDLAKVLTMTGQDLRCRELKEGSVTFRVDVEGEQQLLKPLLQDEVSRIARELLRNAFRHSQASQIEAEIRYEPHLLRLHVRDDGKGIEPEILKTGGRDGHWGLAGVRERAKRIGARLDFWSEAGSGTEVQLTVPASIAYQTNHKESRSWLPWRRGCVRDP